MRPLGANHQELIRPNGQSLTVKESNGSKYSVRHLRPVPPLPPAVCSCLLVRSGLWSRERALHLGTDSQLTCLSCPDKTGCMKCKVHALCKGRRGLKFNVEKVKRNSISKMSKNSLETKSQVMRWVEMSRRAVELHVTGLRITVVSDNPGHRERIWE